MCKREYREERSGLVRKYASVGPVDVTDGGLRRRTKLV